ncbi:MAG: hypothetical protein AAGA03_15700 [Planctomycetota bacterium]
MIDYEGSRGEFLKLLAELGEEPAFVQRARSTQAAWERLLLSCEVKYEALLQWPRKRMSAMVAQLGTDWTGIGKMLRNPQVAGQLRELHLLWSASLPAYHERSWTGRGVLMQFRDSAQRFNRSWEHFLNDVDLDSVNRRRREYNQYYPIEKACAMGSERTVGTFVPMSEVTCDDLRVRFPLLPLPQPK